MTLPTPPVCPQQKMMLRQLSDQTDLIDFLANEYVAAVQAVWPGEHILEYLAAAPGQRHIWNACISRHDPDIWIWSDDDDLEAVRTEFREERGATLIKRHFGGCPNGFLSALGRLSASAEPSALYWLLYEQLQRGPATQKAIRHCRNITLEFLRTLEELDEELHTMAIVRNVASPQMARSINQAMRIYARKVGEYPYERVKVKLAQAKDEAEITETIDEVLKHIPFPKPPWSGTDTITPIADAKSIKLVARRYQNCLADDIPNIIRGRCYFYEWHTDQPAVMKLTNSGQLGWCFDEILHANNEFVDPSSRKEILETLASKGIYEDDWLNVFGLNF